MRAFRSGAIAQLGERLLCKQEVVGSIPSGSTSRDPSGFGKIETSARPSKEKQFRSSNQADGFGIGA